MSDVIEEFFGDRPKAERKKLREKTKKAMQEGFREGFREELKKGMDELSALYAKLFEENRTDDIERINEDREYRDRLLKEMFPPEIQKNVRHKQG